MKKIITIAIIFCVSFTFSITAQTGDRYETAQPKVRFAPLDIYADAGDNSLAAYQFELKAAAGNIEIVGVFGYTDRKAGVALGETPLLIAEVCKLLVIRNLTPLAQTEQRAADLRVNRVTLEQTRDQRIQFSAAQRGGAIGYLTGDSEIDGILEHFMAPIHAGHPGGGVTD